MFPYSPFWESSSAYKFTSLLKTQQPNHPHEDFPNIHMIVRSYAGDADRIFNMLLPSIEAFYVFQESDSFTFVFDNESVLDHVVGNQVLTWAQKRTFPITVQYAQPPSAAVLGCTSIREQ
jgi:hypothetical protein